MKQIRSFQAAVGSAAIVALAVVLAGCGKSDEGAVATTPPQPATTQGPDTAATAPVVGSPEDEKMANAVATGKTAAAVDLKYDVPVKPAAGEHVLEIYEYSHIDSAAVDRRGRTCMTVNITG